LRLLENNIDQKYKIIGGKVMSILKGKKIVIIGDRDGIPGQAIEECVKTAGGEVVFSSTECFV
jgi:hypothetical protein